MLIADIVQTMLECLADRPGDELLALNRELLKLDRHRKISGRAGDKFESPQIIFGDDFGRGVGQAINRP